jgi:hypothetical protein
MVALVVALLLPGQAAAQEVPGGGGWAPAAGAAGDNTYQGFIDQPRPDGTLPAGAAFHVSGWVVDMAAEGWAGIDDIQVLQGDRVVVHGSVGNNRPDVAAVTGNGFWAASGFDALVPAGAVGSGPVTLTVVAHTPGKGAWSKQVSVNIGSGGGVSAAPSSQTGLVLSLLVPGADEEVVGNRNGTVRGVAYDTRTRAELGVGVDRVQVYIDAERDHVGSQFIGEVVPTATTWSMSWEPTRWNSIRHHVMFVYARSTVTGEERLVTREFSIAP